MLFMRATLAGSRSLAVREMEAHMGRKPNLQVTNRGPVLKRPNKHTGHKGYGRRGITRTIQTPRSAVIPIAIDVEDSASEAA